MVVEIVSVSTSSSGDRRKSLGWKMAVVEMELTMVRLVASPVQAVIVEAGLEVAPRICGSW